MLKNNSLLQFFFWLPGFVGLWSCWDVELQSRRNELERGVFLSLNALVLDVLGDEQQELFKVNLLVVVEVKLLHVVGNGLGVDLLAHDLEQCAQLGGANGTVRVLVKDVEALPVVVELFLCEC